MSFFHFMDYQQQRQLYAFTVRLCCVFIVPCAHCVVCPLCRVFIVSCAHYVVCSLCCVVFASGAHGVVCSLCRVLLFASCALLRVVCSYFCRVLLWVSCALLHRVVYSVRRVLLCVHRVVCSSYRVLIVSCTHRVLCSTCPVLIVSCAHRVVCSSCSVLIASCAHRVECQPCHGLIVSCVRCVLCSLCCLLKKLSGWKRCHSTMLLWTEMVHADLLNMWCRVCRKVFSLRFLRCACVHKGNALNVYMAMKLMHLLKCLTSLTPCSHLASRSSAVVVVRWAVFSLDASVHYL